MEPVKNNEKREAFFNFNLGRLLFGDSLNNSSIGRDLYSFLRQCFENVDVLGIAHMDARYAIRSCLSLIDVDGEGGVV